MIRRSLSIFLALTMILLMLPNVAGMSAVADNAPWDGSGTEESPYLIGDREDLLAIANAVNGGDTLQGKFFLQTGDINLEDDEPWPTIGITINNAAHPFRGIFNGDDWNIYGLYVERHDDDAGLFGYVGEDGVIKNVHVKDGYVSGTYWVGGIAGRNYGLVEYSSFSGEVYGRQQYAGGIVGDNHGGLVRYCCAEGYLEFNQIGGGIVGRNSGGTVENCYNRADVCSKNIVRGYAGGVVGENTANSTVENCYSDGWVDSNDDMSRGAIVGANGAGSTVKDCFYPEEFEEDGLPGVGGGTGTLENVTPKSEEDFASGEVAWELSQGKDGAGWGQTLNDGEGNSDKHPHFTNMQDKDYDTTPIYRVYFTANDPDILPEGHLVYYVDPGEEVALPPLPSDAAWFVGNEMFDGKDIQRDIDTYAGKRILFESDGEINHRLTYSTEAQTVDLDMYLKYAEGGPYSEGLFEYAIIADENDLNGTNTADTDEINNKLLSADKKTLTIPAGTSVRDGGYKLKIKAHEKDPFIMPLALTPLPAEDSYVEMTVNILIEKATPVITAEASDINYGTALSGSTLSCTAEHPTTGANVQGTFTWDDGSTVPTVNDAAHTGYPATFNPTGTYAVNYNSVTVTVTLTVNKAAPTFDEPLPEDSTYNGEAEYLIQKVNGEAPTADGGTLKYWITDDPNAEPTDSSVFSSTIPSRSNAGTYYVWYMVVGDDNHTDTEPERLTATIDPYLLDIDASVYYNGEKGFKIELEGARPYGEIQTVIAYITTDSKDAGSYGYYNSAISDNFTVTLSDSNNYTVNTGGTFVIKPLPAVLKWKEPLVFVYNANKTNTVAVEVTNRIGNDVITPKYKKDQYITNEATEEGYYTAEVTDLDNDNYTLYDDDNSAWVQNISQPWRVFKRSGNITLSVRHSDGDQNAPMTYGDKLELTAVITAAHDSDTVKFFVNGEDVKSAVKKSGDQYSVTIDNATVSEHFSLGANIIRAEYTLNDGTTDMDVMTVSVAPKPITVTVTNTDKTYDGNSIAVGIALELDPKEVEPDEIDYVKAVSDHYVYDGRNEAAAASAGENKSISVSVTLIGAQSGNYTIKNADANNIIKTTGTIFPKPIKLEWRGVNGLVYTGDHANVNATATETLPGEECEVYVKDGDGVDAGDYTALATDVSNHNYTLPDDTDDETVNRQPYTIYPADLYIKDGQKVPYNHSKKFSATVDGVTPTGGETEHVDVDITTTYENVGDYTYTADEDDSTGGGTGDGTEFNALDYTYIASTENTNYQIKGGAPLTIEKIDPIYEPPVPIDDLVYNGSQQTLVTAEKVIGGKMQFSFTEDGTYYDELPTDIGKEGETVTVRVFYRIVGDAPNYNDIAPDFVDVTIYASEDDIPNAPPSNTPGWSGGGGGSGGNRPNSPDTTDGDTSGKPNSPNAPDVSDSDTTRQPDSSSSGDGVPNTGVEINYALYFMIMCGCSIAIAGAFRKAK